MKKEFILCNLILLFLPLFSSSVHCNGKNDALHPRILATAEAPAPVSVTTEPPPPTNLTTIMSKKGCKTFSNLASSIPEVMSTFEGDIGGGLTIFCFTDRAVSSFMPKYKNLSADDKASLLLYHGVPVYYNLDTLKTSNGEFNTLATDGTSKNFNFTVQDAGDVVTLKTGITTATIVSTVVDKSPLAIFAVDEVLQPRELFDVVESPSPAPEPSPKKKKAKHVASPPAPEGPEASPADQKAADDNSGGNAAVISSVLVSMVIGGLYLVL